MIVCRIVEAARGIGEAREQGIGEGAGLRQPAGIARRLVELEEAEGEEGVVVKARGQARLARAPAGEQAAVRAEGAEPRCEPRMNSAVSMAATTQAGSSSRRPARARPAIMRPFQAVSTLSSRSGGRARDAGREEPLPRLVGECPSAAGDARALGGLASGSPGT